MVRTQRAVGLNEVCKNVWKRPLVHFVFASDKQMKVTVYCSYRLNGVFYLGRGIRQDVELCYAESHSVENE